MASELNQKYWANLWQRLTEPSPQIKSDEERRRVRMLAGLAVSLIPLAFVILSIWVFANPDFEAAPFISISLIASYIAVYYLSRTPYYNLGIFIFIVSLLIILFVIFYTVPGSPARRALTFMYVPVAILLASIFTSVRNTLGIALISFVTVTIALVTATLPLSETYAFLTFITTMTLLITVAARIRDGHLRQIAKQTQSLTDSEQRYHNVLVAIPDAIYTINLVTQNVTFFKDSFLGYSRDELQAPGSIMHAVHREDYVVVMQHWGRVWASHPAHEAGIEYRLRAKSGIWEWVQMRSIVNKHNPDGTVNELLIVLSIVTQTKEAQQRTLELAIQQERLAFLNNLIRGASHDLKTPLAALNSTLYLLNKAKDDEKKQRYSERLSQQIDDFSSLVTTLFDLTRLDPNARRSLAPVDINLVIHKVCTRLKSLVSTNKITLIKELQEALPPIMGDADELERVIANLLGNAVKYTQKGGQVTITSDKNDHQVIIEVKDTGIGIPAEELPYIFEPFFQVDDAKQHTTDGTGMGLAIVKQIIDLHQGQIEVSSTLAVGSQFKITFPTGVASETTG